MQGCVLCLTVVLGIESIVIDPNIYRLNDGASFEYDYIIYVIIRV